MNIKEYLDFKINLISGSNIPSKKEDKKDGFA
jgi:hypothetical protein